LMSNILMIRDSDQSYMMTDRPIEDRFSFLVFVQNVDGTGDGLGLGMRPNLFDFPLLESLQLLRSS
jgi:hypothetical protein